MKISGNNTINAPSEAVWQALINADILKQAVPGCTELAGSLEDGFQAVVKQKIGPVSATFKAKVTISHIIAGKSYRITGEGDGGVAGFASGFVDVNLDDNGAATVLSYNGEVTIGGKIMQLGARIIDPVVKNLTEQFFNKFQEILGAGDSPNDHDGESEPSDGAQPTKKSWFSGLLGK